MIIGIDVHKLSESVGVMDKDGNIMEEYKIDNTDENRMMFMAKYPKGIFLKPLLLSPMRSDSILRLHALENSCYSGEIHN